MQSSRISHLAAKVTIVSLVWIALLCLRQWHHASSVITEDTNVKMEEELAFTTMPPKHSPRVIFMGNCIFQTTEVIPHLNALKKRYDLDFETGNFARQGATIGDLLIAYHYVKRFQPDLVVIHLDPYAFGYHEPFYKHAARKLIFTPEMKGLWHPIVFRTYNRNELADSFLYSQFPIYRMLPTYKYQTNENIKKFLAAHTSLPVMDFFPYGLIPNLTFLNVSDQRISTYEFPMAKAVTELFIDQLESDHQRAVFILQESHDPNLPVIGGLPDLFKGKYYVSYYDFQKYWNRVDYMDNVHPIEPTGTYQAAHRLLEVIQRHLK